MAVIDSDKFITHLVWSGLIDKATCGELKEAIELCTVKDIYTKADLVAMLTEIQLEIEELDSRAGYDGNGIPTFSTDYIRKKKVNELVQQKINELMKGKDKDENR